MTATWQSETGVTTTFQSGDAMLAFWQSVAIQLDYLQAQINLVLALVRSQTCVGPDLDNWMAQFGFTREAATYGSGPETFSKLTPATSAVQVAPGTIVQTTGGAIQYQVIADTTQSAWNAAANAYVLNAGQSSMTCTVQALVAGAASNVAAGALGQQGSSIPGIDVVTNAAAISNGINAQSDASFRAAFVAWLSTLAKATKAAILAAINAVQQGLLVTLIENETPSGISQQGCFSAICDDGSGDPPSSLLTAITAAVDATRAFGVQAYVAGPNVLTATIAITVRVASGASETTVNAAVAAAVVAAVDANTATGAELYVSTCEAAALAVANVVSVQPGTTINGTNADLTPSSIQEIRTTLNNVSVSNY